MSGRGSEPGGSRRAPKIMKLRRVNLDEAALLAPPPPPRSISDLFAEPDFDLDALVARATARVKAREAAAKLKHETERDLRIAAERERDLDRPLAEWSRPLCGSSSLSDSSRSSRTTRARISSSCAPE